MNLLFRLLKVVLATFLRAKLAPLEASTLSFLTWPNDLDTNLHMNNGRYLTLMDLGRFDLIVRGGLWRVMRAQRWMPLVGAALIRYKRSLQPFQRFTLSTRLLGWDDKWFYIEQRFLRGDVLVAVGLVKALFRGAAGNVPPPEVMRAAGHPNLTSPALPESLAAWTQLESELLHGPAT